MLAFTRMSTNGQLLSAGAEGVLTVLALSQFDPIWLQISIVINETITTEPIIFGARIMISTLGLCKTGTSRVTKSCLRF
jgi:hypothetical protein